MANDKQAKKFTKKQREWLKLYERLAPSFGYETRAESAKPWDEVPLRNKELMAATCTEILKSEALAESSLSQNVDASAPKSPEPRSTQLATRKEKNDD